LQGGRVIQHSLAGRAKEWTRWGLTGRMTAVLAACVGTSLLAGDLITHWSQGDLLWSSVGWGIQAVGILVAARVLGHMVTGPVEHLVLSANRLAAGDLTQSFARTRSDQLGDLEGALSQLSVNLQSVVRDARDQSSEMVTGTTEIAQGNLDLSQRTESQASSLEETASSMEEMTGAVKNAAESAIQASSLSASVLNITERSNEAVRDVGATMRSIQEASSRIGEITQVIDSIAFQTNILALNAAVEAARAGEQGRGFSVVASEVRTLAQRTSVAAKEIKSLIEESADRVQAGHQQTEKAQEAMQQAVDGVRHVNQLVDAISTTAREQLGGISQINAAIAQLDTITQQNAALVEQIASSAQSLEGLARSTTESVQVFRVDGASPSAPNAVALRRAAKAQGAEAAAPAVTLF
jgi:aerotaxis receptor